MGLPRDYEGGAKLMASARHGAAGVEAGRNTSAATGSAAGLSHGDQRPAAEALAAGLWEWSGERRLLVDLEGHGREELGEEVDVSRTVGWFTTLFPVRLEIKAREQPGAALKRIKEQLRGVPQRGIGYGLLRYLRGAEAGPGNCAE